MSNLFANLVRKVLPGAPAPAAAAPTAEVASTTTAAPTGAPAGASGGAAPVQAASESTLAPTTPEPVTLAVIAAHADGRFSQLLAGVVGQVNSETFTINPIYPKIAYLFTLAESGINDNTAMSLAPVTLPSKAAADEFVVNMVASSADRWDQMYARMSGMAGSAGNIGANMLTAERTKTAAACKDVVNSANLTSFEIPVTYDVMITQETRDFRVEINTPAALASTGTVIPLTIAMATPGQPGPDGVTDVYPTELTDEQRNHEGAMELQVSGTATVLASSEANAKAILVELIKVSGAPMLRNLLTLTPQLIQNSNFIPVERENYREFGLGGF